jgi:hypothetical protein
MLMATREEIENAFLQADTAGNTEDAQFFSDTLLSMDGLDNTTEVSKTFGEELSDFVLESAASINRGAVGLLDIPPMLFNAASSLVGSDKRASLVTDLPLISGATKGNFMDEGIARGTVRVAGEVLGGSVLPVANTVRAGNQLLAKSAPLLAARQALPSGAKSVPQSLSASAATAPSQFLKKEATDAALFSGGAGLGSAVSENDPLFEMLGGLTAVTRGAPINLALKTGGAGGETIKQMFSKKAQRLRAVELIKKHSSNPDKALSTLRKNMAANKTGTLSQMTEDAGIAGLEKQMIREGGDDFAVRVSESDSALNNTLVAKFEELGGAGGEGVFREQLQSNIRGAINKVNKVVQRAIDNAKHAAKTVDTPLAPADASRVFSDEKDIAFKAVRALEDDAWSSVPQSLRVKTRGMKEGIRRLQQELTPTARLDIADEIAKPMKLINALSDSVRPKELADLRGSILATKRAVRDSASPNAFKELDNMQKLIGETIDAVDDSSAYRTATAITKEKHKLFNDSLFAKATAKSTPEDIGEKLLRSGGTGGPLADDVIAMADKFNVNLQGASEDMLKASFIKATGNADGTLDSTSVQRFMDKYQNLLTRFPKVSKELMDAQGVQALTDQSIKLGGSAERAIQRSRSKLYSDFDDPIRAIQSAINSKDQSASFRHLVRAAKKDPSGAALQGLKRDTIEHALSHMSSDTQKGVKRLKSTFRARLDKAKPGYREVLSKEEMSRMDELVKEIDSFFIRSKVPSSLDKEVTEQLPTILGSIAGARIGAKFGTTPLIAAGLGRNFAKTHLSKIPKLKAMGLVEDMVLNPANFEKYAEDVVKSKNPEQAMKALHSWLISSGVYTAKVLEEQ